MDKTGTALEEFQTVGELPMENGSINLQLHRPLVSNRSIEDINVQQMITLNGILDCRVMCDPLERTSKVIDLLKVKSCVFDHDVDCVCSWISSKVSNRDFECCKKRRRVPEGSKRGTYLVVFGTLGK